MRDKPLEEVKVDLSKITDPESRARIQGVVEALNNNGIPQAEFLRRVKTINVEEGKFIVEQNPHMSKLVPGGRDENVLSAIITMAMLALLEKKFPHIGEPDPKREVDLKTWIGGFFETGHFTSSAAASDFSDQLINFVSNGHKNPIASKPRKLPTVQ